MRIYLAPLFLAAICGCASEDAVSIGIRNVTVIPMTGHGPLENHTVVVEGDRIAAVGPADEVAIPEGARVLDGEGRYLLPGFVEMHAHVSKARAPSLPLFVVHGVTTVRDMGGDHAELLEWRRQIRSGERVGPRLRLAGPYLESEANVDRMRQDPPEERVEPFERVRIPVGSPADARRIVDSLAALEVDHLKVRTVADQATFRALNQSAEAHGLKLVGHTFGIPPEVILDAGHDGVEHFLFPLLDSLSAEERSTLWRRFADQGVAVVPTLVTFQRSTFAPVEDLRAVLADSLGHLEPERRYVARFTVLDWREQLQERGESSAEDEAFFRHVYQSTLRNLKELHRAGVDLLVGSDVAVLNIFPGASLHDEMELFVDELGLTPQETLERATRRSAEFLGLADSVGIVREGMLADLVLLSADPLQDIRNTRQIAVVVLGGRVLDRDAFRQLRRQVLEAPELRVNDWLR